MTAREDEGLGLNGANDGGCGGGFKKNGRKGKTKNELK